MIVFIDVLFNLFAAEIKHVAIYVLKYLFKMRKRLVQELSVGFLKHSYNNERF